MGEEVRVPWLYRDRIDVTVAAPGGPVQVALVVYFIPAFSFCWSICKCFFGAFALMARPW